MKNSRSDESLAVDAARFCVRHNGAKGSAGNTQTSPRLNTPLLSSTPDLSPLSVQSQCRCPGTNAIDHSPKEQDPGTAPGPCMTMCVQMCLVCLLTKSLRTFFIARSKPKQYVDVHHPPTVHQCAMHGCSTTNEAEWVNLRVETHRIGYKK